jgi:hypothetical protein
MGDVATSLFVHFNFIIQLWNMLLFLKSIHIAYQVKFRIYTMDRYSLHFNSVIVITQGGVIYRAGTHDCCTFQYLVGVNVTPLFVLSFCVHSYFFPVCFFAF